jgi:hypothetical protein
MAEPGNGRQREADDYQFFRFTSPTRYGAAVWARQHARTVFSQVRHQNNPRIGTESMKKIAIVAGCAGAAATAAVVLGLVAAGKADKAGFIGPGGLNADINLVLEVLLVLGLTLGFYLARTGNIEAHRINQTLWVLVNAALVACIMVGSILGFKLNGLADLADPGIGLTWLHALIGSLTALAGLWLVLQMNDILPQRFHITWWKNLMRLTLAGYWIVALLGFATYYFWYAA